MDTETVTKFLDAAKGSRFYTAFLLALGTGLRRGEVLGLHWEDVDFDNRTAFIHRQVVRTNDGPQLVNRTKTKTSTRTIRLPAMIIEELEKAKKNLLENQKTAVLSLAPHGPIFSNVLGEIMEPGNFVRDYKSILKKAGLESHSFHCLRHTCSTSLIENGAPIKAVSELMGHSDVSITMNIYTDVTKNMIDQTSAISNTVLQNCVNK